MELVAKLIVAGLLAALIWYVIQPRYVFVVEIRGADLRVTKGKVTAAFLQIITETCEQNHVRHGWVGGIVRGRNVALAFSRSIPQPCRQQLRNLWVIQR